MKAETSLPSQITELNPKIPLQQSQPNGPRLLWIYSGNLTSALDRATWIETTLELRNLGWQVTLLTAGRGGVENINRVQVQTIRYFRIYLLGQVLYHLLVIKFVLGHWRSTDLVLFHAMSAPWLLPLRWLRILAFGLGPLFVMDSRTLPMAPLHRESARDRFRRRYHLIMEGTANLLADGRLAITSRLACAYSIPQNKLWGIWPSGVRPEAMARARQIRLWPSPESRIELIYIGVTHYERNLAELCKAVEMAIQQGMDFRLTIIGDGTAREELAAIAQYSKGRIRLLGSVPAARIPSYLGDAHVGTLPFPDEAKFRVSSPIKLFEYLAAGLPILATRIACHTDVLDDSTAVFWAEGSDYTSLLAALGEVWHQRAALPALGEIATQQIEQWTWAASTKKLNNALLRGLQAKRGWQ